MSYTSIAKVWGLDIDNNHPRFIWLNSPTFCSLYLLFVRCELCPSVAELSFCHLYLMTHRYETRRNYTPSQDCSLRALSILQNNGKHEALMLRYPCIAPQSSFRTITFTFSNLFVFACMYSHCSSKCKSGWVSMISLLHKPHCPLPGAVVIIPPFSHLHKSLD